MIRMTKNESKSESFGLRFPKFSWFPESSSILAYLSMVALPLAAQLALISGCGQTKNVMSEEAFIGSGSQPNLLQLTDSIKCIGPVPQWYENLWLDINAKQNTLGKSLMSHYITCSGKNYPLSEQEFKNLPVFIIPEKGSKFNLKRETFAQLKNSREIYIGQKIIDLNRSILAATHFGNTLGNFQLSLRGMLVWRQNSMGEIVPRFEGKARIFDRYDFNPSVSTAEESWRGRDTELRVRIAHIALPGKPFEISSDWMDFHFDLPKYDYDLINEGNNGESSGYSEYGERLQAILAVELRSSAWEKASALEKLKTIIRTMQKIHESLKMRSNP